MINKISLLIIILLILILSSSILIKTTNAQEDFARLGDKAPWNANPLYPDLTQRAPDDIINAERQMEEDSRIRKEQKNLRDARKGNMDDDDSDDDNNNIKPAHVALDDIIYAHPSTVHLNANDARFKENRNNDHDNLIRDIHKKFNDKNYMLDIVTKLSIIHTEPLHSNSTTIPFPLIVKDVLVRSSFSCIVVFTSFHNAAVIFAYSICLLTISCGMFSIFSPTV